MHTINDHRRTEKAKRRPPLTHEHKKHAPHRDDFLRNMKTCVVGIFFF